jgi:hypothetical protein
VGQRERLRHFEDGSRLDPARWASLEIERETYEGVLQSKAAAAGQAGKRQENRLDFANQHGVIGMKVDVRVEEVHSTDARVRARIGGRVYNDGTSTGPQDATGDIGYYVTLTALEDGSGALQVKFEAERCDDATCSTATPLDVDSTMGEGYTDLGTVYPGETHNLLLLFDGGAHVYFALDDDPLDENPPRIWVPFSLDIYPTYAARSRQKDIRTDVEVLNEGGYGYIHATFFNVQTNTTMDMLQTPVPDSSLWLGTLLAQQVAGDVATAGVGMRGAGGGTIDLTLPEGATVTNAYLYTAVVGDQPVTPAGTLNTTAIEGTQLIARSDDPGMGYAQTWVYRADVTTLVTAGGSYVLAGFPDGLPPDVGLPPGPDTLGASLVVIYTLDGAPPRMIVIEDGAVTLAGSRVQAYEAQMHAFAAANPLSDARVTYVVGGGDSGTPEYATFNGFSAANNEFSGALGTSWDARTYDVSAYDLAGTTEATVGISTGNDSLVWVATVLSVPGGPPYALLVDKHPESTGTGGVYSWPAGVDCPASELWCGGFFLPGATVTLTATPSPGSVFSGWHGEACLSAGSNPACTVTLSGDTVVMARFDLGVTPSNYTLTVTNLGPGNGSVGSTPAGLSCSGETPGSVCTGSFVPGTVVTLHAFPADGYAFTGWSGEGCPGLAGCSILMDENRSAHVSFGDTLPAGTFALGVTRTGPGTVTSLPGGIDCGATCSAEFGTGSSVVLIASPERDTTFTGWGGACSGTGLSCVVDMHAARSVTAGFQLDGWPLVVFKAGSGSGSVVSDVAGIDCGATCAANFTDGTTVTLTATAGAGSSFLGWAGAGCSGTGTCMITLHQIESVSALFGAANMMGFSQADLADQWHFHMLSDGEDGNAPGWTKLVLTVGATGAVTAGNWNRDDGQSGLLTGGHLLMDAAGFVTGEVTSDGGMTLVLPQAKLDPSKTLLASVTSEPGERGLGIGVKGGGSFATSNLAGDWHLYRYADLITGNAPQWSAATFTVSMGGTVTGGTYATSQGGSGTLTGGFTLDGAGWGTGELIFSEGGGDYFPHVKLSPSKEHLVLISSLTHGRGIAVALKDGGTFSQSDLAGTWHVYDLHDLEAVNAPRWAKATVTIDAAGAVTGGSLVLSDGTVSAITDGAFVIGPNGIVDGALVGDLGSLDFPQGKLDASKGVLVLAGGDAEPFGLAVAIKSTAVSNTAPAIPTGRGQRQADGTTPITLGGTANSTTVVFVGTVSDPDAGQQVRLQVEVQPVGTAFTGAVHCQSPLVSSGTAASCGVSGLTGGTGYHWRLRSMDSHDTPGAWASYATNAETAADFTVNTPPGVPTARGQRQGDGTTPITLGGTANSTTVVFVGTVSDPDAGQQVRLQVEVQPVGTAFTGAVHCESPFVNTATATTCSVGSLTAGTGYHWRLRSLDSKGGAGAWASYATNAETAADFKVNTPPPAPPARGQLQANGTTGIPLGGTATSSTVVFRGTVSDPDAGQTVRLQVEVRPVGTAFSGAVHCESPLVASGTTTTCSVTSLTGGTYHWQARTVDSSGMAGAWASYATNAETAADFKVNTPPPAPAARGQLQANGTTAIPLGGTATLTTVVFRGTVSDPDAGQQVRLQVETQPVGTAFSGAVHCESPLVASGTATTCSVSSLTVGTYHWQARTVDSSGMAGAWASYATNAETAADFKVNTAPGLPTGRTQLQSNGTTAIPLGGTATSTTVVFRGTVSDPDAGQTVRLQVEVKPVGTAFTGTVSCQSAFVNSATAATCSVGNLTPGTSYHWRLRSVDSMGRAGAWVSYAANAETAADFRIAP